MNIDMLVDEARRQDALMDGIVEESERILIKFKYPQIFRAFIEKHLFTAFEIGPVTIFSNIRHEEHNIEDLLSDDYLVPPLVDAGLLPFGRPSTGSYDPVCFDVRGRDNSSDAPIVQIDHESILSWNKVPKPVVLAPGLSELQESRTTRPNQAL